MAPDAITIKEMDEAGTPTATYVCSTAVLRSTANFTEEKTRIDVIVRGCRSLCGFSFCMLFSRLRVAPSRPDVASNGSHEM